MNKAKQLIEWTANEWLHFLSWFFVGLFLIPIGFSLLTEAVALEEFYSGLVPSQFNEGIAWLVIAPYLLYLIYRLFRYFRESEPFTTE